MNNALVRAAIAIMKCHDQSNLDRKGFIWLTFCITVSLKEIKTGIQTGDPAGRS